MRLIALQRRSAWTEDTALPRCNRSAVPGVGVKAGPDLLRSGRSITSHQHQSEKPVWQEATLSNAGSASTLANASRSKFQFTLNQDTDLGGFARWVKVLRTEHKLPSRIRLPFFRRRIGRALDVALRWGCGEPFVRVPRGWNVLIDPLFDERFDELWQTVSPRFPIATVRDSQFLNWRFDLDRQCSYRSQAVVDSRGRLRGYLVYHLVKGVDSVLVCEIADLLPLVES